jgi:hypothetical protein
MVEGARRDELMVLQLELFVRAKEDDARSR